MALINWSEDYSVHVKEMDEQHKKLIAMINDLNDAMKSGKSKDIMDKILKGLIDYTVFHFGAEEKLMKSNNYPGYQQQKTQHESLTKKVMEYQERLNSGKMVMGVEVMNFLKDWLINHIKGLDTKYGPFLNSKGIA
ncbi:MAG TPA: bacteriohemerythrin [Dissulfurispiraceae bacterium]|nr:bacteriohemerythrin [Dissulfurispiraceae bacterium]